MILYLLPLFINQRSNIQKSPCTSAYLQLKYNYTYTKTTHYTSKELIHINIEITSRKKSKELIHRLQSKTEDILFTIFGKIPEKLIPSFLMDWMNQYTDKRLQELKQAAIQLEWKRVYMQKAVQEMKGQQGITKAQQGD